MRISKLKGAENYRPWAIYIQAALESRNVWDIVTGTKVVPSVLSAAATEATQATYTLSVQQHATAKGILILSIDPSILIDKCTTSLAREIWEYYSAQYKEKRFVLRFTLFVHLTISKVSIFRSITAYNADFQITLDKLANTGSTLPSDLQLAAYLHGIEDTYPDFAASQRSAARAHVPDISAVMAELEDEARTPNEPTALPARSSNASRGKSYGRGNGSTRNRGRGSYPTGQGRSTETCSHCHASGHSEPTCWKKYPEKSPKSQKGEQQKKTDSSRNTGNGKKDGTSFNLASTLIPNELYSPETVTALVTKMGRQWNIDSGASDHMCWDKDSFDPATYESFESIRAIQGAGGTLSAIGIGDVHLTVKAPQGHYHDIVLTGVLRCPMLFTNLISASSLKKKGWYLHGGTETLNRCYDDFQLASTPIQNGLYVLQTLHTTSISAIAEASMPTTLKTWHRRLGNPSYSNLQRFGNARGIDMSKFKVNQDLILCKICIKAK